MPLNILVVEDSSSMRALIASAVEELADSEAVQAADGFEALKLLPSRRFDVIITDVNMPSINGLEIVNFIQANETYRKIPIIIVTTEAAVADRDKGLALGAAAYITKPFDPEDLKTLVQRLARRPPRLAV